MAITSATGFNTYDYTHIEFYAKSISSEGAKVRMKFAIKPSKVTSEEVPIDIPSGQWTQFVIPFEDFSLTVLGKQFMGVAFMGGGPGAPPNGPDNNIIFDNITLAKYPDTIPPQLMSAEGIGPTSIRASFSERLNSGDVTNPANFLVLSNSDANFTSGVKPTSVQLLPSEREVELTLNVGMSSGHTYTLRVSNLQDLSGNLISPASEASFTWGEFRVIMTVDATTQVYPFRDMMRGVAMNNWSWIWGGIKDPASAKRRALIDATSYLRPGIIRFAGGLWANKVGWDRSNTAPWNGLWTYTDPDTGQRYSYKHSYRAEMIDSYADFAAQLGAETVIQVNICDNTPNMWADMVTFTNIEKGYNFKYWELGNEIDLKDCITPTEYANRFAVYQAALKAVDPSIKVMGPVPTMPYKTSWYEPLISKVGTDLDVLVWHWYQLTEWTSDTCAFAYEGGSVEALLNYNTGVGTCNNDGFGNPGDVIDPTRLGRMTYRRGIAESMKQVVMDPYRVADPTLEMAITEFGVHATQHEHPINSNHIAAIWLADVLARHAYNGVDIVTYYSLEDGGSGLSNSRGLVGADDDAILDVRPIYYTEFMYSQYFDDMMVQSSSDDPEQKAVVWASKDSTDPGSLKLMFVNLKDQVASATVSVQGFVPQVGYAYEMISTDPMSLDNPRSFTQHQTTINGY